jgi:alkylation response protein AidB-like acyl-CoA dehydrogenase
MTAKVQQALEKLLPEIRERRAEIEQARRLPRDLADKLRATQVFALGVPRAVGGFEAPPTDIMRAVETVATADGSTGWCAMIGVTASFTAGYMNEPGAKEIYTDPAMVVSAPTAPTGAAVAEAGGYRISGRWPFASGITHAEWAWGGCIVMEDGQPKMTPRGPQMLWAYMPIDQFQIHDTWYVSGLSGTGSNDVSVENVFVPEQRTFHLFDPSGHRPEPAYQMPTVGSFVSNLACVGLGIARTALDELTELAQDKKPTMSMAVLADKPVAQVDLARAEAALGSARAFLYETVDELWQTVSAGNAFDPKQAARNRIAAIHAVETAATVARTANTLAGGSSIYSSSSLQRHARDAEAVTHHFTVAPHTWEDGGRVLLGREPVAPVFF